MSTAPIARLPLRSLLFHYIDVDLLDYASDAVLAEETTSSYMLLVFKSGNGKLFTESFSASFSPDSTFLLSPSAAYQFESVNDSQIEYFRISFRIFHIEGGQAAPYVIPLFPDRQELRIYPQTQWNDLLNQLYVGHTNQHDLEAHRQQLHFQKIIEFLLEHNLQVDQLQSSAQTVEQTIQYMQTNFQDNITVKQLAHMANVPSWQFTSIFKELTGKKPLDYLTELRINRAKEWLTHTESTLREIAERVGFTDEYYFSRRFRLMTGFSPRQYAISMSQNILVKDWNGHEVRIPSHPSRVLYCGETVGDMNMLGIPLIENHIFCKDNPLSQELASKLSPDLIIFDHYDEALYSQISQIAPTLTYNSRGSLNDRLLMLGKWFGKKKEAQQWLLHHNSNTLLMWKQLRTLIRPEETASVFVFHRGKRLFVMGNIGLSSILYHPDGFRPAGKVQQIWNSGRPYKEITAKTIHQYAGDRVFMMLPQSPESKAAMEELMNSPVWFNLPAVKNGFSYLLDEQDWNIEDAAARDKLLSLLPQLLTQSS
ncbi:AraC-like DNA-binding protein [Paenibacillus endophyticus]|uniref:AraC-like DNA-binding protein n=1 Tax=Paenibacillus endophyticus TaxID=1294268 RepID=A0A7W5G979_9BACL|nr:helix-turn-helix domain-containing protein [Paenibacillus endophyticus]MBB3151376.1 AraC-like DNA-binding protein [Paenibacillus endophyticus]